MGSSSSELRAHQLLHKCLMTLPTPNDRREGLLVLMMARLLLLLVLFEKMAVEQKGFLPRALRMLKRQT